MSARESEVIFLDETDVIVRHPLAKDLRECGYKVLEASTDDRAGLAANRGRGSVAEMEADQLDGVTYPIFD